MDDYTKRPTTFIDDELDLDLDLFDGDDDVEAAEPSGKTRQKRYKPRRLRSAPNWSRIAVAIGVAAVFLMVLVLAVRALVDHRREQAFRDYFQQVENVAVQSNAQGEELAQLIATPAGTDRAELIQRVEKLAEQADEIVGQTQDIQPPAPMKKSHPWLITTMKYRENGLNSLQQALVTALESKTDEEAALTMAESMWRLVASDVVYADSFRTNAQQALEAGDVTGISVPESQFATADPEIGSAKNMGLVLERLQATALPGAKGADKAPVKGVHGLGLDTATMQPSGKELQTVGTNEVEGSSDLALEVLVHNQGEGQEAQVPVTVELRGANSEPQQFEATIDLIDPGQKLAVEVPIDEQPTFGEPLTMTVKVGEVPGEKITANNSATYQVLFSL